MKIKSIVIELEREDTDMIGHATEIVFRDGCWSANGPMYSRITGSLNEIWKLLRGSK